MRAGVKPQRPFGVKMLIFLQIANALIILALIIFVNLNEVKRELEGIDLDEVNQSLAIDGLYALLGLVIAYGLYRLRYWAWIAIILWAGTRMVNSLSLYFEGEPDYLVMVRDVVIVFYMNQREVQQVFVKGKQ